MYLRNDAFSLVRQRSWVSVLYGFYMSNGVAGHFSSGADLLESWDDTFNFVLGR